MVAPSPLTKPGQRSRDRAVAAAVMVAEAAVMVAAEVDMEGAVEVEAAGAIKHVHRGKR
jgi:hypothetical protein